MAIEIRGSHTNTWDVYVDGTALPGFVERFGGRYHVHLGGMRGMPWPSFATLGEAAQAVADFHTGKRR